MTNDQVLTALQSDSKLSFVFPTSTISQSVHFGLDPSQSWQSQVAYSDIISYINTQSKPGLSSLRTGKLAVTGNSKTPTYTDGYFYAVKLTYVKKVPQDIAKQFANKLSVLKAQYGGW